MGFSGLSEPTVCTCPGVRMRMIRDKAAMIENTQARGFSLSTSLTHPQADHFSSGDSDRYVPIFTEALAHPRAKTLSSGTGGYQVSQGSSVVCSTLLAHIYNVRQLSR